MVVLFYRVMKQLALGSSLVDKGLKAWALSYSLALFPGFLISLEVKKLRHLQLYLPWANPQCHTTTAKLTLPHLNCFCQMLCHGNEKGHFGLEMESSGRTLS